MRNHGLLARRPNGAPTALVQGLVSEASRDAVRDASRASGVKISYYLDALILGIVREHGRLPVVELPHPDPTNQIDEIADLLGNTDPAEVKALVGLQGRVSPEAWEAVRAATEASRVPKTYYLEGLIKRLCMGSGAMPLVDSPRRDRVNQLELISAFTEVANRSAA